MQYPTIPYALALLHINLPIGSVLSLIPPIPPSCTNNIHSNGVQII